MAFNGIFDKEAPVTVSYETWNKMVTAADRLETLVTLILDDSTLDGSEEGLMYDNDCGCFGALSYLKAVYYDEYQAKLSRRPANETGTILLRCLWQANRHERS